MNPEPIETLVRNKPPHDVRVRLDERGIWLDTLVGVGSSEELTMSIPLTGDEANKLAELLRNATEHQSDDHLYYGGPGKDDPDDFLGNNFMGMDWRPERPEEDGE